MGWVAPFRAWLNVVFGFPRRCPGLLLDRAVGAAGVFDIAGVRHAGGYRAEGVLRQAKGERDEGGQAHTDGHGRLVALRIKWTCNRARDWGMGWVAPFRDWLNGVSGFPGRCPGLLLDRAVGTAGVFDVAGVRHARGDNLLFITISRTGGREIH